ncbi:MAG: cell division protein FtsH, partial [Clostridia bacterium]|nr:cell division protein FtsH [Clostridia bacterium]
KAITNVDLYEAINKVLIGPQKKSRVVTESDKRITAYHEAGHAILARLLPGCDPVQEVSIIPRGLAAGYTMTRPDNDNTHVNKSDLLDSIVMTLGGRVAEELIIKDISAGASNDISVVTDNARKMVTEWGMSDKIGPVNYSGEGQVFIGKDMQTRATYSEALAQIIDEEVELIIKNAHQKATKLLKENKSKLDNMARLLVERETIYQDEVDMIMNGVDANEIMKIMEARDENYRDNPFYKMTEKMENEEGVAKSENVENSVENPTEIATENSESVNE